MRKLIIFLTILTLTIYAKDIYITKGLKEVTIKKNGVAYTIKRDRKTIPKAYTKTLRGVIAPMKIDKEIETIGELEEVKYFKESEKNNSIAIVDARTIDWFDKMHIPSAISVPYTSFVDKDEAIDTLVSEFNIKVKKDKTLDFSKAKTLIIYCNGIWCGQSEMLIKKAQYSLIKLGYPKSKIKYYRGGMQSWVTLGFSTQKED